jgi:hypothetical protein
LPNGTSYSQASPWMSVFASSYWRECNELHFISGLPPVGVLPQGIQLITGTADFIRHFQPMNAAGTRQHPQQGPLLSSSAGGSGGGDGSDTPARSTKGFSGLGGREATPFRGNMTQYLSCVTRSGGATDPVMNPVLEAIFGNRTAAWVLLFLQCYGEGHALRIAKTFGFGLNMTQRQLKRLEEEGVLVSRLVGNIRLFSFNDRNPTVRNLKELLEAELKLLPNEQVQQYFRERQRPRQSGKALVHHG